MSDNCVNPFSTNIFDMLNTINDRTETGKSCGSIYFITSDFKIIETHV